MSNKKTSPAEQKRLNDGDLKVLRKCLDLYDPNEIHAALVTYSRTIELIIAEHPKMPVSVKKDWAIANALSPDWFGDALTTRIQNTMLVSALLLTVTSVSFMDPIGSGGTNLAAGYRVACYINGICSAFFLLSIFLGICFIENAMSRAYCWSDRFSLIITHYAVKDVSQICAALGTILFPVTLLCPMNQNYVVADATFMYVAYATYTLAVIYVQIKTMTDAAAKQLIRTRRLDAITDPKTGRLLHQFAPLGFEAGEDAAETDEDKPERVFEMMYVTK